MKDNISEYGAGPGRPKGVANKITVRIREAFAALLEGQMDELEAYIQRIAVEDPKGAVELIIKISERFVPKLNQTAITGADGEALNLEFKFGKKEDIEPTDFNIEEV